LAAVCSHSAKRPRVKRKNELSIDYVMCRQFTRWTRLTEQDGYQLKETVDLHDVSVAELSGSCNIATVSIQTVVVKV